MKILFSLFLSVFLGNASVAETDWLDDTELREQAKAMTITLERKTWVYHWVPRKHVAIDGQVDKDIVIANMKERMELFSDPKKEITGYLSNGEVAAPNGLYVASDPIASRRYGGRHNALLYEIALPARTVIINGRDESPIGEELQEALRERGCENPLSETTEVFSTRALIKAGTEDLACRHALLDLRKALRAQAVAYDFAEKPMDGCSEENRAAFVLFDVEVSPEGLHVYSTSEKPGEDSDRNERYRRINKIFVQGGHWKRPFNNFANSAKGIAAEADQDEFIRSYFFGCEDF